MPTIADIRAKVPALEGLDDNHAVDYLHSVYYPRADRAELARRLGVQEAAAPAAPRGAIRAVADTALSFGRGAVQGVRMLSDVAGADNPVSGALRTAEDFIGSLQSAQAQQDQQEVARILKEAEGQGILDQVVSGFQALAVAPVQTVANAAGTMVPTVAASMLVPGAGPTALAARTGAAGAMGAAQGVGTVKGTIYDDVTQAHLAAGMAPNEAVARGARAQAYSSENMPQLAIGAGLGALAGSTGVERLAGRLAAGAPGAAAVPVRRAVTGAVAEAIPEAAQGGQEKFASNTALVNEGFPGVDPWQGVAANATLEGAAGAPLGAAFAVPKPHGPVERALQAAADRPAAPPEAGLALDDVPFPAAAKPPLAVAPDAPAGVPFEADGRFENAPVYPNGAAPAVQQYGTKQATDIAIGEQGLMGSHDAVEVRPGVFEIQPRGGAASVVAPGIYETTSAAPPPAARAERPAPPVEPQSDVSRGQEAPAAPMPAQPAPVVLPPRSDAAAIAQREADRPAEPTGQPLPTDITGPAGKPFVTMRSAMRVQAQTPGAEIVPVAGGLVVRRPEVVASESAPAAPGLPGVEAAPAPEPGPAPLPGDVLHPAGHPFRNRPAAVHAMKAKGDGFTVAKVAGGFAVRRRAGEWQEFPPATGTKGIPRAEMPQIKAEHRGPLTQFLLGRGIRHEQAEVPAADLKPTQGEFSPGKVAGAREFVGENRAILVSSDGHVLDGHHQWLAKLEAGQPIRVIRFDAPIDQLVQEARQFPSAEQSAGATPVQGATDTASAETAPAAAGPVGDQRVDLPAVPAGDEPGTGAGAPAAAADVALQDGPSEAGRAGAGTEARDAEAQPAVGSHAGGNAAGEAGVSGVAAPATAEAAGVGRPPAARNNELIELRKREAVLKPLQVCVAAGSLTSCLKKAGNALGAADRGAIHARAGALRREGMKAGAAALQAVDERLAEVQRLIAEIAGAEGAAPPAAEPAATPAKPDGARERRQRLAAERSAAPADSPAAAASKPKRSTAAQRAADAHAAKLADYFTPGNVVKGYGGHDRVLAFKPAAGTGAGEGWSVQVQHVVKQGDEWVPEKNERPRWHSTTPDAKQLQAGPVARAPAQAPAAANAEGAAKPAAPESIQDAGEKIGGARKDRWKERGLDVADLDAMSETEGATLATKANVWKPDYEAMAAASDPMTAAMVKVVYDSLAAKPAKDTPQGRRDYVTAMQAVRKVFGAVKTVAEAKEAYQQLRMELGLRAQRPDGSGWHDTKDQDGRRVLFSVYKGRSDPFVFGYNEIARAKKLVADGFPDIAPWKRRFSVREFGGPGTTQAGVNYYVLEALRLGADAATITDEQVRAGFFAVNTKDGKTVAMAATRADAEAAAAALYERTKGADDSRADPERPHLDKVVREGLPAAMDRDVTTDDFMSTFGWRGIEFGNWAAQDERQRLLNMAFDALSDLAVILNVPRKALSLNGTMGLAFGARGGGRFAAHYEPGRLVINMTKLRGAGSLAHEFAHALDHYLGELNTSSAYQGNARGASGWYSQGRYTGKTQRLTNLRPELSAAIDGVMQRLYETPIPQDEASAIAKRDVERTEQMLAGEKDARLKAVYEDGLKGRRALLASLEAGEPSDRTRKSSFAEHAQKLSGKSADGYWLRPTEMFARAFEAYVFDRLVAMGARSDYLVHGVEQDRYADGTRYKGNPYPEGDERAAINAAFDKLVGEIKTREDDAGNVAMLSRAPSSNKDKVGSSRVDLQACKLEYSIVSPK